MRVCVCVARGAGVLRMANACTDSLQGSLFTVNAVRYNVAAVLGAAQLDPPKSNITVSR